MTPDDDGTELTPLEIANEMYLGAVQEVCDAVEKWLDAQVSGVELSAVEPYEVALSDAFFRYEARRDELRALSEAAAEGD